MKEVEVAVQQDLHVNLIVEILLHRKSDQGLSARVFDYINTDIISDLTAADEFSFAVAAAERSHLSDALPIVQEDLEQGA